MRPQWTTYSNILFWLACAVPPAIALWITARYATFVPSLHYLEFVQLSEEIIQQGYPSIASLLKHINEHQIISFNLLFAAMGMLHPSLLLPTRESMIFNAYGSHVSILLTAFFLLAIASRTHKTQPTWRRRILLVNMLLMLFSISQFSIWIIPHFLFVLSTTVAICALCLLFLWPRKWITFISAVSLALFTSFGFAGGFAVWPAALPILWNTLSDDPRLRLKRVVIWIILSVLALSIFLFRLNAIKSMYVNSDAISNVYSWNILLEFMFVLLGSSIWRSVFIAKASGILLLVAFIVSIIRLRRSTHLTTPWIGVFIYAIVNAVLIAIGRTHFGIEYALMPRYLVLTCLGWIALLYLLSLAIRKNGIFVLCASSMITLQLLPWHWSRNEILSSYIYWKQTEACMETYEISSNACLNPAGVNNENNFVRDQLRRSEQLGLFSSMPLPQATFEGESNETNGYFQFNSAKESADIIVKGWAALHGCPAEHIFLTTGKDRQYVGHTTAVKKRNDLVEKTVQRCMKTSGWEVQIDANIADGEGVESLEAWIWDEETNQMLPIKRSK